MKIKLTILATLFLLALPCAAAPKCQPQKAPNPKNVDKTEKPKHRCQCGDMCAKALTHDMCRIEDCDGKAERRTVAQLCLPQ
jgi:hypothetical protein